MNRKRILVALLALAVGASAWYETAPAQKTKGKTRAATTHQLMEGLVGPTCGALGKALKAKKSNWKEISLRAALLNESGYILMADGRCPDAEWKKGATTLQTASADLLGAAKKEDIEGARTAFGKLTGNGCKVCHTKHKGK